MPVPGSDRLRFQFYRCVNCKRLLTKLEILRGWQAAEARLKAGQPETGHPGTCPCGGGKVQATNMTPEEAAVLTSLKQKIRYFVLRRNDADTRVVELWRHEVLTLPRGLGWVGRLLPTWETPGGAK